MIRNPPADHPRASTKGLVQKLTVSSSAGGVTAEGMPKGASIVSEGPGRMFPGLFAGEGTPGRRRKTGSRSSEGTESPERAACQSGSRGPKSFSSQEPSGRDRKAVRSAPNWERMRSGMRLVSIVSGCRQILYHLSYMGSQYDLHIIK